MLFFGLAMMAMMIFRPQGLLPPRRRRYDARKLMGRYECGIQRQCGAAYNPYAEDEGSAS
jgi:branched-chain amino acid transport system permease protein